MQSRSRPTAILALLFPLAMTSPVQAGTHLIKVGAGYCYACHFDLPLNGSNTETRVISSNTSENTIEGADTSLSLPCPFPYAMVGISIEDTSSNSLNENVLPDEEEVVDDAGGAACSIPALSLPGSNGGDSDRLYCLDDQEYLKLRRIVAADFLAPNFGQDGTTAHLAVHTLGFHAAENPFSSSFLFGCRTLIGLWEISPEFWYPDLGVFGNLDTHGRLLMDCRVDQDADGVFETDGVQGAILQTASSGAGIMSSTVAWTRLLAQSVTTGDSVTQLLGGSIGTPGLN